MATSDLKHLNSLSLLALKVAPNVFDLSSGMHHVSIRDQMVRAQLLVQDLIAADPDVKEIVIIGASVAGLSAAIEAAGRGVRVVVLEAANQPFSRFIGCFKRYVGPYMYEWPSHFFGDQSYPAHQQLPWAGSAVSPLSWNSQHPCSADDLAKELTQSLLDQLEFLGGNNPTICVGIPKAMVQHHVECFVDAIERRHKARLAGSPLPSMHSTWLQDPRKWPKRPRGIRRNGLRITPAYLLLAGGMGQEDLQLVKFDLNGQPYKGPHFTGTPFWQDDTLLDAGTENTHVAIFGGGDGALQDVLRALTGEPHPLLLLEKLKTSEATARALAGVMDELLSLDRQARQMTSWRLQHDYRHLDDACQRIAKHVARRRGVVQHVGRLIRAGSGSVALVVRDRHFGKAYLLNRFLVHLIWACAQRGSSTWAGRMRLDIQFYSRACSYRPQLHSHEVDVLCCGTVSTLTADTIAVRYGIQPDSVPGAQMIQLSAQDSGQRTTLARVELPFVMET